MSESLPDQPVATASPHAGSDLGARIRHARLRHNLTLRQVADLASCSESAVSKFERNLASPSLAMLHRLALALGTNISDLTAQEWPDAGPVQRAGSRPLQVLGQDAGSGVALEKLTGTMRGGLLQANIHVIAPGARSDGLIDHLGEEIGYVLEGEILLQLGTDTWRLAPGDSFHFASQTPHGYENPGNVSARVLWVNTPPTF
jgi:transcriptional regulator with XRE-family HTH domain